MPSRRLIEIGTTLPSLRVIAVLEELLALHGLPQHVRVDNGQELTSLALTVRHVPHQAPLHPARQAAADAFIERFNRTYRTEILDARDFGLLAEVRELTSDWPYCYSHRPHDSLGRVPPLAYHRDPGALLESTA